MGNFCRLDRILRNIRVFLDIELAEARQFSILFHAKEHAIRVLKCLCKLLRCGDSGGFLKNMRDGFMVGAAQVCKKAGKDIKVFYC